jgi:predicted transcriptional regulator
MSWKRARTVTVSRPPARVSVALAQPVADSIATDYFTTTWADSIRPALRLILSRDFVQLAGKREFIFQRVKSLVSLGMTNELVGKIYEEITAFNQVIFESSDALVEIFEDYIESLDWLIALFGSLDRDLIWRDSRAMRAEYSSLSHLAYSSWRQFLESKDMIRPLVKETLAYTAAWRKDVIVNGGSQPVDQIARRINILVKTGIFGRFFSTELYNTTRDFYMKIVDQDSIASSGLVGFVGLMERVWNSERSLIESTGMPVGSTWKYIESEILLPQLILAHLPGLIQTNLQTVLNSRESNRPILASIFKLAGSVDRSLIQESVLKHTFGTCVKTIVRNGIESHIEGATDALMTVLITSRDYLSDIISGCFGGSQSFVQTLRDALESVLNEFGDKIPAMLAEYLDFIMISIFNGQIPPSRLPSLFADVMYLFKLVAAKDIFEARHRILLAKRLLCLVSVRSGLGYANMAIDPAELTELELSTIVALKNECGNGYVSRMDTMLRDIVPSEELSKLSRECGKRKSSDSTTYNCTVLTTSAWPPGGVSPWEGVVTPVADWETSMRKQYGVRFPKKSVKFVHAFSNCLIRASKRDIICSAAQACILSLFNDSDSMSIEVILQETQLPPKEVHRAIETLVQAGVIHSENTGGLLSYNQQWTPDTTVSRHAPVCLNMYQFRRVESSGGHRASALTQEERVQSEAHVMEDRQHHLDALIVRIMKQRKEVSETTLFAEVNTSSKIFFSQMEVKKRIMSLMDREFLEKDERSNNTIFKYLI